MRQPCEPDHGLRRITHDAGAPDDMLMGRHFGASAHANRCLRNVTELNEQGTIYSEQDLNMSDLTIVRIPSLCKSWSLLQSRTTGSRSKGKLEVVEDMENIGKANFGGTPDFLLYRCFND